MESFWRTPTTETATTTATKTKTHCSAKHPVRRVGRLKHRTINPTKYKTPTIQRNMEEYIQRTAPTEGVPTRQRSEEDKKKGQKVSISGKIAEVVIK